MTIPATAKEFLQPLDPSDELDFYGQISQGEAATDILMPGENVASFALTMTAEGAAAGLQILTDTAHLPVIEDRVLRFWVKVDEQTQSHKMFDGLGIVVGIVLSIVTDANPERKKQRTNVIRVVNQ